MKQYPQDILHRKLERFMLSLNMIMKIYDHKHRFYHNWNHITTMLDKAYTEGILTDNLLFAIVYHDICYDPKRDDNEELSAKMFLNHFANVHDSYVTKNQVEQAILDTKTHKPSNKISEHLCRLDLDVLYSDYKTFIDYEHKIFKEYQYVPYAKYVEKRIDILYSFGVNPEFINYVQYRKPNIAIYPGSFNPFHLGHLNILLKAEEIFDKVIIAVGQNPQKQKSESVFEFPESLKNRQIEQYDGLLTDFLEKIGNETVIRGLRNTTDLQYELTQYRYLEDLKNDIKVISIFCDKKFEHISSSAIRSLSEFGKSKRYLLEY